MNDSRREVIVNRLTSFRKIRVLRKDVDKYANLWYNKKGPNMKIEDAKNLRKNDMVKLRKTNKFVRITDAFASSDEDVIYIEYVDEKNDTKIVTNRDVC